MRFTIFGAYLYLVYLSPQQTQLEVIMNYRVNI